MEFLDKLEVQFSGHYDLKRTTITIRGTAAL